MMKVLTIVALVGCVAYAQQQVPFLQGASASVLSSFNTILSSSGGLTEAQLEEKVKAWVATQNPAIQKSFDEFNKKAEKARKDEEKAHADAVKKFSPAAKAADEALTKVANDGSLSIEAKSQKIDEILSNLQKTNPSAAQELQSAMQS